MKHAVLTCDCLDPERHGLPVIPIIDPPVGRNRCMHCGVDADKLQKSIIERVYTIIALSGMKPADFMAVIRIIRRGLEQPE